MSRKVRERKMERLEEIAVEKLEIAARRQARLLPVYKMIRKFALALFLTVLILYVGFIINGRLGPNS